LFERFIDVTRSDLPDIDLDFCKKRRGEIMDYLRDKYGEENVAQIATIGKLSGKQCLKDVSRVFQVPFQVVNELTDNVIERDKGDARVDNTLEDSFNELDAFKEFDKRYPKVKEHAVKLEGLAKTLGVHAAGVIVTPEPVHNYVPLEARKDEGERVVVTALDKEGCAALGLIKLDILGLKTLTVLQDCIEAVERRHGIRINPDTDIDLDDPEVLQLFSDRDSVGLFQFDSPSAIKVCENIMFTSFKDVCAINALNRPGTMRSGLTERWRSRKQNPELVKEVLFHPKVAKLTSDTLGVICYQEDVIRIFKEIGNFNPEGANKFRKDMAKSKGAETVEKNRKKFMKGAMENGLSEKKASALMTAIAQFGAYAFNKSHSVSYTIISVWTAYFKKNYPIEFFWANMKNEDKVEKIQRFAKDAIDHGVKLLPPDVSISGKNFVIDYDNNAIRGSLLDIKGVGEKAVETIIQNQPYVSFIDFANRVERRKCHVGVVVALAKAGALDELLPNVKWFVENNKEYWSIATKKGFDSVASKRELVSSYRQPDFDLEEKQLMAISVNPLALGGRPIDAYKDFISRTLKVKISSPGAKDFFKKNNNKGTYVVGTISDVKIRRVGDFNTNKEYTDTEKKKMRFGEQFANVNLDCSDGSQIRIKFDYDVYNDVKSVLSSGVNTPLIAHVVPNFDYKSIRGDYVINLEDFMKKIKQKNELEFWEKIVVGEHPVLSYPWKNEKTKEKWASNESFRSGQRGGRFCGIVTHVRTKADKKGQEMAFFGLQGVKQHIECVCFGSNWPLIRKGLDVKGLVIIDLKKDGNNFIYDAGFFKIFRKKINF
jgi:DNA-directed DNA polymerase III PolC